MKQIDLTPETAEEAGFQNDVLTVRRRFGASAGQRLLDAMAAARRDGADKFEIARMAHAAAAKASVVH